MSEYHKIYHQVISCLVNEFDFGHYGNTNLNLVGDLEDWAIKKDEKESIIATPPKPKKTKVSYELVTDLDTNGIAKAMIDGETFYNNDGSESYKWGGGLFINQSYKEIIVKGKFYRRIENSLEWWEDLDSLKFPMVCVYKDNGSFAIWDEDIFKGMTRLDYVKNWRPATREEVQELLNNVWEG